MSQPAHAPSEHEAILAELLRRGLAYRAKNGKLAVRYVGALSLAHDRGLIATHTTLVQIPSDANGQVAVVHAEAVFGRDGHELSFAGLGTCSPANANKETKIYPVEMAETRAIVRALKQGINAGDLQYADIAGDEVNEETGEITPRATAPRADPRPLHAVPGPQRMAGGPSDWEPVPQATPQAAQGPTPAQLARYDALNALATAFLGRGLKGRPTKAARLAELCANLEHGITEATLPQGTGTQVCNPAQLAALKAFGETLEGAQREVFGYMLADIGPGFEPTVSLSFDDVRAALSGEIPAEELPR